MPLETATFINQLVASNPAHTDGLNQGDGHLRLIKSVLQAQFPNFTAVALNSTEAQLDAAVNVLTGVSGQAAFPAGTVGAPSISFTGDPDSGWFKPAEDQIELSLNGVNQLLMTTSSAAFAQNITTAGTISPTGAYTGGTGQLCPVGAILMYQGSAPPTGWAWLNGGTVTSAANPGLNSIYGNTGGNITLPDWRCYVPGGVDNMGGAGTTGRIASFTGMQTTVGETNHTLTTGQCPTGLFSFNDAQHSHGFTTGSGNTHFLTRGTGPNADTVGGSTVTLGDSFSINNAFTGCSISDHGGNQSHNNVQLTIATGFIIKLG